MFVIGLSYMFVDMQIVSVIVAVRKCFRLSVFRLFGLLYALRRHSIWRWSKMAEEKNCPTTANYDWIKTKNFEWFSFENILAINWMLSSEMNKSNCIQFKEVVYCSARILIEELQCQSQFKQWTEFLGKQNQRKKWKKQTKKESDGKSSNG